MSTLSYFCTIDFKKKDAIINPSNRFDYALRRKINLSYNFIIRCMIIFAGIV